MGPTPIGFEILLGDLFVINEKIHNRSKALFLSLDIIETPQKAPNFYLKYPKSTFKLPLLKYMHTCVVLLCVIK